MTKGRPIRIDDFLVTLADADGAQRTFTRDGDKPKVEIEDPLKPHKDLLRTYEDKNGSEQEFDGPPHLRGFLDQ